MTREEFANETPREDLMREALKHYEELATKACWHRSDIPAAIRAYYVPLPPAEGKDVADLKQYMTNMVYYVRDNAKDMNSAQFDKWAEEHINGIAEFLKQQQPTAEGAEEILAKEQFEAIVKSTCEDVWYGRRSLNPVKEQTDLIVERLYPLFENATLHAQKIADKMVGDRLREELALYHRWIQKNKYTNIKHSHHECAVEYLKSRE